MKKVSSDIYDITQTVVDLEKDYMEEESEDTLTLGTYGYLADILSRNIQNSIIVTSELGNELFPYKAKFEDNVIAHAIVQNITDIEGFFKAIDGCKGKVELVTGEGDRLNLKSKLSQYVSLATIFSNGEIPEMEIVAHEKEDIDRLISYMING